MKIRTALCITGPLVLTSITSFARAQEAVIPDPGLNLSVRIALNKPSAPLTEEDMLGFTYLDSVQHGFSYGDDPQFLSLTNYAWFLDFRILDLTVHSVGLKGPNPWGLYDMYGNVWEWCQDDYGPLPGGVQVDPTGPGSSRLRDKVMRGGAYDYPISSCRSVSRLFRFPVLPDSDVGFRVVLVNEP